MRFQIKRVLLLSYSRFWHRIWFKLTRLTQIHALAFVYKRHSARRVRFALFVSFAPIVVASIPPLVVLFVFFASSPRAPGRRRRSCPLLSRTPCRLRQPPSFLLLTTSTSLSPMTRFRLSKSISLFPLHFPIRAFCSRPARLFVQRPS